MGEAIEKVRASLGRDALIVSTRTFRRGGVLGVGSQKMVEVFATDTRARIENVQRERSNRTRVGEVESSAVGKSDSVVAVAEGSGERPSGAAHTREENIEEIQRAIGQVRQEIRDLMSRSGSGVIFDQPFLADCHELLLAREVDARLAERIVKQISRLNVPNGLPDPVRVRAMVRSQLMGLFVPSPPLDQRRKPRIIILVGPTGVGKTTTIAKLAARAKINEQQKVGLVTLDTYRIAAVDQLDKYAHIIGLPMRVAKDPGELKGAVEGFRTQGVDLVFIDSAGRSQRDELKMAELREFLSVLPEAEVHLVVSATTHAKTIESIANRFADIDFHMLILTKLDETVAFGALVGALTSIGRPVSFVTDGQNVPDDIMPGEPERLSDLVLKTNAL